MMTVQEVSRLTGVTVRALRYYDKIGLLSPARYTEAGYRLYDEAALERLQQILLFRELEFSLKDIQEILDRPGFDRNQALDQHIDLLKLKQERIGRLILLAREIRQKGGGTMDFSAFDTKQFDEYAKQAKEQWGDTQAYREYAEKTDGQTREDLQKAGDGLMAIFAVCGTMRDRDPADPALQAQVKRLQSYITEHYYTCDNRILSGLGKLYAAGGDFTRNIDAAGGAGTAELVNRAIQVYCGTN